MNTPPPLQLRPARGRAGRRPRGVPLLRACKSARWTCSCPTAAQAHFGSGQAAAAALRLLDWKVCSAALRSATSALPRSYIAGDWTTPDLVALLQLFIANRDAIER
jgi:cyclopropane-fatty-acyl-phospholipid synthase